MRAEAKMPQQTPRTGTLPPMERAVADVERAMHTALDGLPGDLPAVAREQLAGGGRRRRVQLVLGVAQAMGVRLEQAVPFAAACELLHNATLVHDDIQDGDRMRRGQPALWVRHGVNEAINAGDLLLLAPLRALDHPALPLGARYLLMRVLTERACETACGQSMEFALKGLQPPTWAHYAAAARGKSGPFFAAAVEGVAILAGTEKTKAKALGDALLDLARSRRWRRR